MATALSMWQRARRVGRGAAIIAVGLVLSGIFTCAGLGQARAADIVATVTDEPGRPLPEAVVTVVPEGGTPMPPGFAPALATATIDHREAVRARLGE